MALRNIACNIILTAFLFLVSCGPSVTFNAPQPADAKILLRFPGGIQGNYLSSDGVSILSISENAIIKTEDMDVSIPKDSIAGNGYSLKDDTLINNNTLEKEKVHISGDTVFQHIHWVDTLFQISDRDILKKFKGFYFLNTRYDTNVWVIRKLWLKNGILIISEISGEDDIKNLKEITETNVDTSFYNFQINKKQFKEFLKREGFEKTDSFRKMRK